MLLDPRNGAAYDLPPPAGPPRRYLIASTPRTGSTLLCRALWDTGLVGAPKEYLNPMQLRDWELRLGGPLSKLHHRPLRGPLLGLVGRVGWGEPKIQAHLSRVIERRSSGGWFGLKLHQHHLQRWFDGDLTRLEVERVVLITRDDKVAQAVSWARAAQTGRWASTQRESLPPVYSRRLIQARLEDVYAQERSWEAALRAAGVEALRVRYESLVSSRAEVVRGVLSHLGCVDASLTHVPEADLERQADGVNEAWTRRFLEAR